jgi:hypothetical protein
VIGSARSEAVAREARIIRTVGKVRGMVVPRSDLRRVVKARYRLQILGFGLHRVSENRTDFLLQTHGGHAPTFFCDEMSNSDQIFPSCPFNTGYA